MVLLELFPALGISPEAEREPDALSRPCGSAACPLLEYVCFSAKV